MRLLRALVVLAEEGHVGRAAVRLHLTQPALSKQLASLERVTGLTLFRRHPHGLLVTEAGRLLADRAEQVLLAAQSFDVLAARARRSLTGRLVLGFVGQAANEQTPDLLRAYHQAHPDVTVELRQHDMRDLTAGLVSGDSDVALLRLPVGAPGLAHEAVLVEPRVAVLPDTHPLAGRVSIQLAELLGEPWVVSVSLDRVYQDFALETAARRGHPPMTGPSVRNIDEYLEAVRAGQGIGLAPASAARYYGRPGVVYVPVPDARPSVCALSWSTDGNPSGPAQALIDLVRSRFVIPMGTRDVERHDAAPRP